MHSILVTFLKIIKADPVRCLELRTNSTFDYPKAQVIFVASIRAADGTYLVVKIYNPAFG